MHWLPALLAVSIPLAAALGKDQAVGVRGVLKCGDKPLAHTEVKLWELNHFPNPDDVLGKVNTDAEGRFEVSGTKSELTGINPVVKIYHNCNNNFRITSPLKSLCKRKVTYKIPKSYINTGRVPTKFYDMGTVNMEAKQPDEDTECLGK